MQHVSYECMRRALNICSTTRTAPAISLLTGGKLELIPDLFRAMTLCCLMDGECYIATEAATQKIVGTALWFPPGKKLWATYVGPFPPDCSSTHVAHASQGRVEAS